jgi:multiple sugar transport system ATP-binding protein
MTMGDRIAVLADGILQQVDSPRNLYNSPDNIFVAGFIGSPSMNFFNGTLITEEGDLFVDTGDFRAKLPEDRKNCCADYEGKEVVLGVRPEHIHAPKYAPPNIDPSEIVGEVDVMELLGAELHLYVTTGKNTFVATVDPRMDVNPGNKIDLVLDMSAAHLFDKETERSIR